MGIYTIIVLLAGIYIGVRWAPKISDLIIHLKINEFLRIKKVTYENEDNDKQYH